MTVSAISHYRGGTEEEVVPLAKSLHAIYRTYSVGYRLSRFHTGPNAGDWLVTVTYPDEAARAKAEALFPDDADLQRVFIAISQFARRISRDIVIDLDL